MKRFVLIFFTAIFCICAARAFAEIPAAANLPTQKDFLHKLFLFEGITCAEAYPKVGLKNEKLDERVSDFLWKASAHATEQPDSRFLEELERQGRLLYLDGCDDPMMQFMYARLSLEMHNDVAAAQFFRWAAQSLGKQGYAPVWQAQAASQARKIFDGVGDKDQAQKFDPLIIDAVHAMLKSALYDNSNRDLLIAQITSIIEPLPALTRRTLWESIKDDRAIDPVALLMIEGFYEYSAAYEFHAGEADFPHADHLALAGDSFFRAWQLDESLPDAAVAMLRLAAPDDSRTWLERATTARFDDPQAYSAYMSKLTNMADHKALLEFGQECFDTARFDTEVPLIYLQTKIAARDEIDAGDISDWMAPNFYQQIKTLFQRSLAADGVHTDDRYLRSLAAAFFVQIEKWDDAVAMIARINGPLDPRATQLLHLTPAEVRGAAIAYSSSSGGDASAAYELASEGHFQRALEKYEKALANQKDPAAMATLRNAAQAMRWQNDFYHGKDVLLQPDKNFTGFRAAQGYWRLEPDGGIIGQATHDDELNLVCLANFGEAWELQADFSFYSNTADWNSCGLTLADIGDPHELGLVLSPKDSTFSLRKAHGGNRHIEPCDLKQINTFRVRRAGQRVVVWINGREVLDDDLFAAHAGGIKIGLGGWPMRVGDVLHYTNLRISQIRPHH